MARRWVRMLMSVIGVVLCFAVFGIVGCSDEDAAPAEIYGVTAIDVNTVYDGIPHFIEPINVLETDEIYYSASSDGPWRSERISFTMPGEYIVYYKVVRDGCADFISFAKITIARSVLSGIRADDVVYIYDGEPHGINIIGVRPTDTVSYSTDGVNFSSTCEIKDPGEYIVYYRVSDGYGDYFDECSVTVLPDVSGRYLNADGGLILLDNHTAVFNGETLELKYGADGRGTIGGAEFAVSDSGITLDGNDYVGLCDGEYVYKLTSGDSAVYVAAADGAQISVEFNAEKTTAEIKVDSNAVLTRHGVNYCESISTVALERRYDSSDVSAEVTASGQVTAVDIVMSLRTVLSLELEPVRIIYDGKPHSAAVVETSNISGKALYLIGDEYVSEPPKFTEPNEYTVNIVVLSDGCLPAFAELTVIILPNIDGVYSNASDVIEIDGYTARINTVSVPCEYIDGAMWIDGEKVTVTSTGIAVASAEFVKRAADEAVLLLDYNGERIILVNAFDISVRVHDGIVEISGNVSRTGFAAGEVVVTVNGKVVSGVVSDDGIVYIFGMSELDAPVVVLSISF